MRAPVFGKAQGPANLVDLLRERARVQPDAAACLYLSDGEVAKGESTFAALDAQARAIAARLQGLGAAGETAVLLYPPGLEFISAFFGCLYANVLAIPLPVPRVHASAAQFVGIVRDLSARVLLTTTGSMTRLGRLNLAELDTLVTLCTDDTADALARAWRPPTIADDAVAYLQYTSGSTADRKGVAVRHRNVIANLRGIAERFRHEDDAVCVNWLPHTHDLGLVGGILQPLYHGHPCVLMSPTAFVQQPIRWLNAISTYRGTYSNSPNFGYDLCVRRTTPEQRERLDLSCWRVALNGAEPVRRQTIDDFARMFSACGFRPQAMFPAYGLAEATLVVSGGLRDAAPVVLEVDAGALEHDRIAAAVPGAAARSMMGCGQAIEETSIRIVDPNTGLPREDSEIGEIWVRGPGVTAGYWRKPSDTAQSFNATVTNDGDDAYLRTGDLGFMRAGELFVTGRLKDLIIIRGANHYPQDIEWTIEQSDPAFRPGCGAAFSVDGPDGERLIVTVELEREHLHSVDPAHLLRSARRAVAEAHDLHLDALLLLKTGTVPRTTSGKIQRSRCRADFLADRLSVVWASSAADAPPAAQPQNEPVLRADHEAPRSRAGEIVAWLRGYADERLNSRLIDERRTIPPHVLLDFGNRGILGLQVPASYGGLQFGYVEALNVIEQIGAIDETLAMMVIVQNSLGIWPILHHANPALRDEYLPRLASGRELAAFAMTEPQAGSNPQAIESTATPDGADAWRLNGTKSWSGSAGWASVINVFVQNLDGDGRPRGTSGFVVPRMTRGLRMGPEALTLGMRGMVQNTIYLEGARVTRQHALGEVGDGMKVARDAMMQGRLAIGAACIGGMKRCLQLLLRYAERRAIATGRLVDNPVFLARAGELTSVVAGLESLVGQVASCLDAGTTVPEDVLIACKTAGSEWLWRAADDLVQFLGGRGYIETNGAAQLLRDARVTRILEGPTEALGMFLGSRVINDGTALHRFISEQLRAPRVAERLATVASEVQGLCRSKLTDDMGEAGAQRWASALVGRVATDALLLAALPSAGDRQLLCAAEERLERSSARAQALATAGVAVDAAALARSVQRYTAAIGDIEQALAGEDQALDAMLARQRGVDAPPSFVPVPEPAPPLRAAVALPEEFSSSPPASVAGGRALSRPVDASPAAIERFVIARLAAALKIHESAVDPNRSFFDYGLDSVTTVLLVAALEEWLGMECSPELPYDIRIIRAYAHDIARQYAAAASRA